MDAALGTLNWALLPEGAYTGSRLAAWISSNFATATYSETTNSLSVAYDGNRLILNDLELQQQFPNVVDYPTSPAASPSKPFSIDHMLGPSFVSGGQQVFEFVRMMAYLRCPQLANASRVLGNLGDDILSKITLKSGVGTIVETGSDDGHAALAPTAGEVAGAMAATAGWRGGNGGAGRWACRRRSLRPRTRHGLGAGEHALPAPAGQRGRGRAGLRSANNMNDATQPQHFILRSGSSNSGSPASSRASAQSGFRVQAQTNHTPRPFSWGLNPVTLPQSQPNSRASSRSSGRQSRLPPPSYDQLAQDIEAA